MSCRGGRGRRFKLLHIHSPTTTRPVGMSEKHTFQRLSHWHIHWCLAAHLNPKGHPGVMIIKITATFDNYDLWGKISLYLTQITTLSLKWYWRTTKTVTLGWLMMIFFCSCWKIDVICATVFIIRSTAIPWPPAIFKLFDAIVLMLSINHKTLINGLRQFVPSDVAEQECSS